MTDTDRLVTQLQTAGPAIGEPARRRRVALTDALARCRDSDTEYDRFLSLPRRRLLTRTSDAGVLSGARVLITGGTGMIGSKLAEAALAADAADVTLLARGESVPVAPNPAARLIRADVRDSDAVRGAIHSVRPNFVFHLAAVRDPGRAEVDHAESVSTNVSGTVNVLAAAAAVDATFVYASTGKASRYYSSAVYAGTKKIGEWLCASTRLPVPCAVARFTHVADNSIVHHRLRRAVRRGALTLHAPYLAMYAQSAAESADLLLAAASRAATPASTGAVPVLSMRHLGAPFELLDIALGVRADARSNAPLVFTGLPAGYEQSAFPGLYDPATLDECGPLVNALESLVAQDALSGTVNVVPAMHDAGYDPVIDELVSAGTSGHAWDLRAPLDAAVAVITQRRFAEHTLPTLNRISRLGRGYDHLDRDHRTTVHLLNVARSFAAHVA